MPTPQRLPRVNQDDGTWGDILIQYLEKEHFNDDDGGNADNGGHKTITVRAGTASAGTAPLKFTSGTLLTTPEAGAIEFNSDKLYFTKTTGPTRQTIATYDTSGSTGDIYYRDSSSNFVRLAIGGSDGDVLTVSSGLPSWQTPSSGTSYTLAPVRVASTSSLTFTISSGNVTQISGTTVDGVSPSVNDRILIKDAPASTGGGSADSSQPGNGVYTVTSNSSNLSVSRVTDMSGSVIPAGLSVFVEAGTVNATNAFVVSTPSSNAAFTYGSGNIQWTTHSSDSGTGTLTNKTLTAPKFADLGYIADANGNELIILDTVTSAVNEVTFANAATGGNPTFTATGGDTDVGINFLPKAAGKFNFKATSSGPAEIRLFEDSDNGTNYAGIIAPASLSGNLTITLPSATGTLGLAGSTTEHLATASSQSVPSNIKGAWITLIGCGGAGGSGRRGSSVTARFGGGGGGGGAAIFDYYIPSSALDATYTATVPTAPTGGAAVTVDSTNGNSGGSAATDVKFESGSFTLAVSSGDPGGGGTSGSSTGGIGATKGFYLGADGGKGASGATPGDPGVDGATNTLGGAGGGGGGGISSGSYSDGYAGGGAVIHNYSGGSGGVVDGATPGAGSSAQGGVCGAAAGGGASITGGAAQNGANATAYGAGGGGGSGSTNSNNSGVGGNGGPGYCRIIWDIA